MYKVFICDLPLILTAGNPATFGHSKTLSIAFDGVETFIQCIELLETGQASSGITISCKDESKLWRMFQNQFRNIPAAGGMVTDGKDRLLCIYRNGRWDLPKGKCESGESERETALREVQEECGITDLRMIGSPVKTYHMYRINNEVVLKTTHWFPMHYVGGNHFVPQMSEGITKVKWMRKDSGELLGNTYASIKELIKKRL